MRDDTFDLYCAMIECVRTGWRFIKYGSIFENVVRITAKIICHNGALMSSGDNFEIILDRPTMLPALLDLLLGELRISRVSIIEIYEVNAQSVLHSVLDQQIHD